MISATIVQRRARPDPRSLVGEGKLEEIVGVVASTNASLVLFDHDLTPSQLRNIEARLPVHRHRPLAAHPRHLRSPRANPRRPAPGRTRPARIPASPPLRPRPRHEPARRRYRNQGSWRNPARDRSPQDQPAHRPHQGSARLRPAHPPPAALPPRRAVPVPVVALVGYTNAGQEHALQRSHRGRRARVRPHVCHARPQTPPASASLAPQDPPLRHGRLHPQLALTHW